MVSPPGKKKVSLKEYKKQEKDKKAAHQKAAANKTVDNGGSSKVADDVIPTLEQVELAMTEITITGPADTFIEQSKGAEVAISSMSEGTLEPPRAAVEVGNNPTTVPSDIELVEPSYGHLQESNTASASISLANESLAVSHAVVDVSEHVTVIHSPVDTAYQNALLNSERPEVIYDLDNYLTREFIEAMLIENMDDARAMLARKARMDRMLEPRMYDLQVVKVGWAAEYEDVVGIPNVIRNWILQHIGHLVDSMNQLPDFTADISGQISPVVYTPPSSSDGGIFPDASPELSTHHGMQPVGHLVDSMNQLPDFTADISGQTPPVFYTPPSSSEGGIFPAASPEPSTHHGMHTPHTVDASVQASPIYTPGSSSNDSSVIVVLPVEGPATVSDEGQAASRLPVALP